MTLKNGQSVEQHGVATRLALSLDEAAQAIGVSRRTLDGLDVPRVRLGRRRVVVPVEALKRWLVESSGEQARASQLQPLSTGA